MLGPAATIASPSSITPSRRRGMITDVGEKQRVQERGDQTRETTSSPSRMGQLARLARSSPPPPPALCTPSPLPVDHPSPTCNPAVRLHEGSEGKKQVTDEAHTFVRVCFPSSPSLLAAVTAAVHATLLPVLAHLPTAQLLPAHRRTCSVFIAVVVGIVVAHSQLSVMCRSCPWHASVVVVVQRVACR
ncbi:hypothetical protein BDN70DRAFT_902359, partial [Pholiota conissans]